MHRPDRCSPATGCSSTPGTIAYEPRSNVVDVYVRYLREKIDRPFGRDSLETVRGMGYRLRTDRMSRLPLRVRLSLAFAAGDGGRARRLGRVPLLPARRLARRADRSEPSRAQARTRRPLGGAGRREESFAQVLARTALRPAHRRSRARSLLSREPATREHLRRARGSGSRRRPVPPARRSGDEAGRRSSSARRSRIGTRRSTGCSPQLLDRRPLALLALDAGSATCSPAPRSGPSRRCAAAPPRSRRDEPGAAAAAARGPRRDPPARRDAQRDARAARGRARARAPLRRRREPRAPHAAGAPPDRARARPAPAPHAARSSSRRSARPPRRSTASCASPRTCSCSRAPTRGLPLAASRSRAGAARDRRRAGSPERPSGGRSSSSRDGDDDRRRPAPARAGARQPRRQRAPPRRRNDPPRGRAARMTVELRVSDEGPGFPPELLPRAFDRFTRADEARERRRSRARPRDRRRRREGSRRTGSRRGLDRDDRATGLATLSFRSRSAASSPGRASGARDELVRREADAAVRRAAGLGVEEDPRPAAGDDRAHVELDHREMRGMRACSCESPGVVVRNGGRRAARTCWKVL